MESYESLMEGTIYGPVIVPGDSSHSVLNMLVEGRLNQSLRTPHPLTDEEIAILRLWVNQGAKTINWLIIDICWSVSAQF